MGYAVIAIFKNTDRVRGAEPLRTSLQPLEIRQDSLRTAPRSERFCIPSFLRLFLHLAIVYRVKRKKCVEKNGLGFTFDKLEIFTSEQQRFFLDRVWRKRYDKGIKSDKKAGNYYCRDKIEEETKVVP
jgi:hypothetical protein